MAIPNVPRAVLNLTAAKLRHGARQWRSVTKSLARFGRHLRRQQEIVQNAPAHVRRRLQRGAAAVVRTRNRWERFDDHVLRPYAIERRVERQLARAARSGRPIVVGPWTSEVGYEALYWVPFLHWAVDHYRVDRQRVIAVSRGGTTSWYRDVAASYVDIFDCMPPEEFAAEMRVRRESGDQKQTSSSPFDVRLVETAARRCGADDVVVWHPALMYELFRPFWYGDRALQYLLRHTDYDRARASLVRATQWGGPEGPPRQTETGGPEGPPLQTETGGPEGPPRHPLHLPSGPYAAVKFYTGPSLPDSPGTRAALVQYVERLAAKMPVVMLDTAWSVDEHEDYALDHVPGVTTLRPSLEPRSNLGLQTQVIAGAQLFVGTCGGLAWLAPLLGVPTVAVYEDDRFLTAHLYAARYAYRYSKAASFSTLNLRALRRRAGD